ncbi:MAG: DUF499 domain-containing protein [Chloroflexi bacterium]|nr:DUF499 domain-containing protein [Chloroflexota bacterium]
MKPWHQVVVPHPDIRAGRFDASVFAADLSDVVAERGPVEYLDTQTFFSKTYLTQGLENLISAALSRLADLGNGEAIIQIQTAFGGGKTHSLIALYHLFTAGDKLSSTEITSQILRNMGLTKVPDARVVTFVGTAADSLKGKTPWGELAEQLGNYQLLLEHDQKRRAPGKDLLHQLLAEKTVLILMDEIAEYVVKAKDFSDQVMAFFHELTETVKVLPRCALIVTLPSSVPYGEEGERALHQLQRIFGRVEALYTPVEGEEIYQIIRRRLFEDAPDPSEARRVADKYWEIYQGLGNDVPREVRETSYKDKLRKAYPFHPELIDVLFERWSTFPTFQRTRGVLRLLAEVLEDLYRREHPAALIQPAHLNLAVPAIRREFLKHVGNEYEGVIASDIADGNAKAQKIDNEMGSEYARFGIGTGLATSIFFYSFSGSEKRGVGIQRLRLAVVREGVQPAVIGDALWRLGEKLPFLHVEGGEYYFSTQPNLNHFIVEKEDAVRGEQITELIRSRVEESAGNELRVTSWPKTTQDVPDSRDLQLAVLSAEQPKQSEGTSLVVEHLLGKCGPVFRTYQNTLLILAPDASELSSLRPKVKLFLALCAIRDDKVLMRQLAEEDRKKVESKLRDLEGAISFGMLSAYRHVAKAGESSVEWLNMGLPTVGERASLARRVREYLRGEELLISKASPQLLIRKALHEDEQEKPVSDVVNAFLKYPQLPVVESQGVVIEAIIRGVRESMFGVKVGEQIFFGETLAEGTLQYGAVLVRKEVIEQGKLIGPSPASSSGGKPPEVLQRGIQETSTNPFSENNAEQPASGFQTVRLRTRVPWDKLSDFVRGVVMPLQNDGAELDVEVFIQARSRSGGIKQSTLEQKVKETLAQIGARILEDSRE